MGQLLNLNCPLDGQSVSH